MKHRAYPRPTLDARHHGTKSFRQHDPRSRRIAELTNKHGIGGAEKRSYGIKHRERSRLRMSQVNANSRIAYPTRSLDGQFPQNGAVVLALTRPTRQTNL